MSTSVYAHTERSEVHDLLPASARSFLDVGCNDGGFGAWLKAQDPRRTVWGLEVDRGRAAVARRACDEVVVGAYPEALAQVSRTFDCVTFNHVLEHLEDPWAALRRTHGVIAPGGCVVAVIPNVGYLLTVWDLAVRQRWEYTDSGILDRTHLRFFTERSVRPLFESAGFRVEVVRRVNRIASVSQPLLSTLAGSVLGARAYGGFAVRATPL